MSDIITPKAPRAGLGWVEGPEVPKWVSLGYLAKAWYHPGQHIGVISAVEVARDADGIDRGPEYHISISKRIPNGTATGEPVRCSRQEALTTLVHFDLLDAEEDNHVRHGVVRNFWRPVADRFVGLECACKDAEPAVVEDKGDYVWRDAPEPRP